MTITRSYLCRGTNRITQHRFEYLHHPSIEDDPLPQNCPHCGLDWWVHPPWAEVTMPHIGKPIKSGVDGMYRAMEEGAEHRANVAMELHGMDADEARLMKITDIKDNVHYGDTSNIEVSNPVSEVMASAPGIFGFQDRGQGLSYSQLAHDTPIASERNVGARAQAMVRKMHQENMANSGHVGTTTSTLPALETQQPGYRRRV